MYLLQRAVVKRRDIVTIWEGMRGSRERSYGEGRGDKGGQFMEETGAALVESGVEAESDFPGLDFDLGGIFFFFGWGRLSDYADGL